MAVDESNRHFSHPLYSHIQSVPGLSVGLTTLDKLLSWGASNSLWVFPMATSCCGIEFMAAAASRFDAPTTILQAPILADIPEAALLCYRSGKRIWPI